MMRGKDAAADAGTSVTGGQSVMNPWVTIGGVATTTVCQPNEFIMPDAAVMGDVLVHQAARNTGGRQRTSGSSSLSAGTGSNWSSPRMKSKRRTRASDSMARLNRTTARLMHKYNAHGATDVPVSALHGHAQNLAQPEERGVVVIHNLPVIAKMGAAG